jgi:vitellogenic carboxypeptidase-like protein
MATKVNLTEVPHLESYSGYIGIEKEKKSALFYWMFPAQLSVTERGLNPPVIVFLPGGPGFSSLMQVFNGVGPLKVDSDIHLHLNSITWTLNYTVVYFDNPVGTGFSYALDDSLYSSNGLEVSDNMYMALQVLFAHYPSLRKSDLYLWGESFGGKMIPSLATTIITNNKNPVNPYISLVGIGIGNPLSDPLFQSTSFADFAQQSGLIDKYQYQMIYAMQGKLMDMAKQGYWADAQKYFFNLVFTITGMAGNVSEHDITNYTRKPVYDTYYVDYVNLDRVKDALHVGTDAQFNHFSKVVAAHMADDYLRSEKHLFQGLIRVGLKILLYSGVLDLICNTPGIEAMIYTIDFPDFVDQFLVAPRTIWKVDDSVAGFQKKFKTFNFVWVTEAGHWALNQQPYKLLHLVNNFINATHEPNDN